MTTFDQSHNFYAHRCEIVDQSRHLAHCYSIIQKVESNTTGGLYGACALAIEKGLCPAAQKRLEELSAFRTLYYRDRDDCGSGVVSRAELGLPERTEAEKAAHHALLKELGLEPASRSPAVSAATPTPRRSKPAKAPPAATKAATRLPSTADLITEAAEAAGAV